MDEMYTVEEEILLEERRSSLEEPADMKVHEKTRRRPKPYRRSHSLAEIRRPSAIFIPEGYLLLYSIKLLSGVIQKHLMLLINLLYKKQSAIL